MYRTVFFIDVFDNL